MKTDAPTPGEPAAEPKFYILDVEASRRLDLALWWGPNNSGYTTRLEDAGLYTAEQVRSDQSYYDNGDRAKAFNAVVIESFARKVVGMVDVRRNTDRASFAATEGSPAHAK